TAEANGLWLPGYRILLSESQRGVPRRSAMNHKNTPATWAGVNQNQDDGFKADIVLVRKPGSALIRA
ncbi:hypothetical protein, partial [Shewanella algae]|uniref:hypothetical protein n=1 Tax=Shewanella algae TaxID=38313 RepID=UPI00399B3643